MKKKTIIIFVVILFVLASIPIWFFGYYTRKNNDNIPSKELMVTYYEEKGEIFTTYKIKG